MGHDHGAAALSGRRLLMSLAATLAFVGVEAFAGWRSNSLGLLSDAGHNLADAAALGISWWALRLASRPSSHEKTFGLHRAGILAALFNAMTLVVIAGFIFWEAILRLRNPVAVESGVMIAVAFLSVLMNTAISLALRGGAKDDLNVRSAYMHMLGDAISAAGVVVAGLVVRATGSLMADPVVSLMIAALILWSSWDILQEAVNVLLEATPRGLDMEALEAAVRAVPGVRDVHDLHVWTVGSDLNACSCHILVEEQTIRRGEQVLRTIVTMLKSRFKIAHTTVQIEVEGCERDDIYCIMEKVEREHAHEGEHGRTTTITDGTNR